MVEIYMQEGTVWQLHEKSSSCYCALLVVLRRKYREKQPLITHAAHKQMHTCCEWLWYILFPIKEVVHWLLIHNTIDLRCTDLDAMQSHSCAHCTSEEW